MRSCDESRTVRAWVLRDILRGRLAAAPDSHGVRLRSARITGRLDLDNITSAVSLGLNGCLLEQGVSACHAHLAAVDLSGCLLDHPTDPALDTEDLTTTLLSLNQSIVIGHSARGAANMNGARLGWLDCTGARLGNDSGPALQAENLQVDQNVFLSGGFEAVGVGESGAVQLSGAHLGGLDLTGARLRNDSGPALAAENLQTDKNVSLSGGFEAVGAGLQGVVSLAGAHIRGQLNGTGARLHSDSGPALVGDTVQVDQNVFLSGGFEAFGVGESGAVRLSGARLGGLDLTGARLRNDSGPALQAENLQVALDVFMRDGFEAIGAGDLGAVRLLGAHLRRLECDGARLRNDSGPALHADNLQVALDVFMRGGFEATGARESGAVRLLGAHLGALDCRGARLRNDSGPALHAQNLQVDQNVFMRDGFEATGAGESGAVDVVGARIGGLDCTGARLRNDSGPALAADTLQVDQNVFLSGRFEAVGVGVSGAVRLSGAHLGALDCESARLRNDSGPALQAENLQVDQNVFMRDGFEAVGAGELGTVRLLGAHLRRLECDGARLRNDSGPALQAQNLHVALDVFMRDGFEATGAGESGAVSLLGAHLGALDCTGARLRNDSGPALQAQNLQVALDVSLSDGFEATGADDTAVVNLGGVQVGGVLRFDPARLGHLDDPQARLQVDGLVYTGLPQGISTDDWLRLLRDGTPAYAAQPYQQLAAANRAAGHEGQARRILMDQRHNQIQRRALAGRAERTWARLTGLALGYGYQPWRALIGLLAAITIAVILSITLGGQGGLARVQNTPAPAACTVVERIGVGLDLGTPLISTGARAHCDTTNTTTGTILTSAGWTLRLLAWAFATLFIAGFTGAVRKT